LAISGATVYLILFIARLLLAALFLIAGVSKLLSGFAKSRKALADFDVPEWFVAPINIALPCMDLVTGCLLLPGRSALIATVSAAPKFVAPPAGSGCDHSG
jgi:uncharacterized membrane protein YphA (DoxX/SURF4 family)